VPRAEPGAGFRAPLQSSLALHPEVLSTSGLPGYAETIRAKYRFALSRYREDSRQAGFEMFPDFVAGTHYVMGWCGQAEAAGYAMLGLDRLLGDPAMVARGVRALDLLAKSPFNADGIHARSTPRKPGLGPSSTSFPRGRRWRILPAQSGLGAGSRG
jgi:hypothetical protein